MRLVREIVKVLGCPFKAGESGNTLVGTMLLSGGVLLAIGAMQQKNILFKSQASRSKSETILDKTARMSLEAVNTFNHNYRTSQGKRWIQISDNGQGLFLADNLSGTPGFIRSNIVISSGKNIGSFLFSYCDLNKMKSTDTQVFGYSNRPESQFNCSGKTVNVRVTLSRANPTSGDAVLKAYALDPNTNQTKELSAKFNFPKNPITINDSDVVKDLNVLINFNGNVEVCVDHSNGVVEMQALSGTTMDHAFYANFNTKMNSGANDKLLGRLEVEGRLYYQLPGNWMYVKSSSPFAERFFYCDGSAYPINSTLPSYTKSFSGSRTCFNFKGNNVGRICNNLKWSLYVSDE